MDKQKRARDGEGAFKTPPQNFMGGNNNRSNMQK